MKLETEERSHLDSILKAASTLKALKLIVQSNEILYSDNIEFLKTKLEKGEKASIYDWNAKQIEYKMIAKDYSNKKSGKHFLIELQNEDSGKSCEIMAT